DLVNALADLWCAGDLSSVEKRKRLGARLPTQKRLAQRLDVEHRLMNRAQTNVVNLHSFQRCSLDADVEALRKNPPDWVHVGKKGKFGPLEEAPDVPPKHFDIGRKAAQPLKNAFNTFHSIEADTLAPGTVLYRVLDPKSIDNSICWMTK